MVWEAKVFDPNWPFEVLAPDFKLTRDTTTLLLVDINRGNLKYEPRSQLHSDYPEIADYWNRRIEEVVLPNTRILLDFFRQNELRTVFVRNRFTSQAQNTTACKLYEKITNLGSSISNHEVRSSAYLDYVLPIKNDDIIIDKILPQALSATFLDHILRNMNVINIVLAGILTDMCVFDISRTVAEAGYNVIICEDACATLTPRAHNDALLMHARAFGRVSTARDIIAELEQA